MRDLKIIDVEIFSMKEIKIEECVLILILLLLVIRLILFIGIGVVIF